VDGRAAATAEWTYETVGDLGSALAGADAVLLSTQYDPAETFVHDLDIPKKYGVYGAVSATTGPGGILRAMRTIPLYREFAAAVREHCPDAWVCNFTNPVTFVIRALYDEYPEIDAVGLCHGVLGTRISYSI
jgi:alpha-galactosidase